MDIKSKGKWIFKNLDKIILVIIALSISLAIVFIVKNNYKYAVILTCIAIGLLIGKLLVSDLKIIFLIYALEGTIKDIDDNKTSINDMTKRFSDEVPFFLKNSTKIYESVVEITENIRGYVQNRSINEQVINRLINNVINKLEDPMEKLEKGISEISYNKEKLDELEVEALYTKKLIEDLFESTKATGGVLNLNREITDINYILKQAVAEFYSGINESKLNYEVNIEDRKVLLNIDPEKVWRVFQIILENTLKHSMDKTRVYIDSYLEDGVYTIAFKSISKYGLNISEGELYKIIESKNDRKCTGLPLETAKSIIAMLDGSFEIFIDGDLFKIVIKFNGKENDVNDSSSV